MKTVMIAEDNDSNYMLMTYILKHNYSVVRARNGQEAIDMAEKGGVDLILMDLKMPVCDGLEATCRIKSMMPDIPIVMLTANAFDTDRRKAMDVGCDEFLSKPVNREKCLSVIARFI
ncbi:response regulator [Xylanibacter rodentium]|jgi:CheY-like chemotaxis protein|uniref:Response regulator n=1 Tax=Xylanibacter rodentium TaxID=2736289 RepID=A0ABX2AUR5_9BACT|nr:response regulator [Xylanibacter rodentium]NPE12209.1 response regulator [Prevotella sp. PJ1A]NPE14497.1 response regulator [Xylanibacter rodentium]NPE39659.1 response regulator [Prevotella sp. PCJ2]